MKIIKTFEMFDSEWEKDINEIPYLRGELNKKDLATNISKFDSKKINDTILESVPFFRRGNPQVMLDKVVYIFGDIDNYLKYTIKSNKLNTKYIVNEYEMETEYKKSGNESEKNFESKDIMSLDEIIKFFKSEVSNIQNEFKIGKKYSTTEFGSLN